MTAGIGELFWEFLQIGLCSIGGGYATIPLIQAQVVEGRHWLTLQEFTDILTISQMTPGPLAVNVSTFVGLRTAGIPGAIAATAGMCTVRMCDRAAAFRGVPAVRAVARDGTGAGRTAGRIGWADRVGGRFDRDAVDLAADGRDRMEGAVPTDAHADLAAVGQASSHAGDAVQRRGRRAAIRDIEQPKRTKNVSGNWLSYGGILVY